ncbi:transcription elongation factor A protein 1-like isoform X2 [Dysidea avara]
MALDLLRALQSLPMNLDLLQKSRIGMSTNVLRKKSQSPEVTVIAKKLIKSWKKLLPSNGKEATTPEERPEPAPRLPTPPPPPSYTPSTPTDMPNTPDINTLPNGGSGSEPTTPTAVLKPPQFAADISGIAREPPTGDAIRDKCRVMLCTALKKGRSEVSPSDEIKFNNLAAYIEDNIFKEHRDTGIKYKSRVRSRVSNLGDLKNPTLREKVICGDFPPARIATMATEEMASDNMKKLRNEMTKEAIRDAQLAQVTGTKSDLLKCSKCKKRNCSYTQAQTRSADEPMTTFAYCNDCGYRWKFC